MYRRYSQVNDGNVTLSQLKKNRLKNVIILLLVLAIGVLIALGLPMMQSQQEEKTLYIQRIQNECSEAIRLTSTLSRNGGADSAAILARIRSNIYAIRMINSLSISKGQGEVISENQVVALQNAVDRYLSFLTTGMDTGEYQTGLQNDLNALQTLINSLN